MQKREQEQNESARDLSPKPTSKEIKTMQFGYKQTGRTTQVILATLFMVSSAAAQKVATDYDRSADFSKFKTYAWTPSKNPAKDPLWHQRIIENIDQQLTAKGLKKVDGEADLHVTYTGNLKEITSLQGIGSGGRWLGGSFSVNTSTQVEGTLIVELYDAHSDSLVWRGIATESVSDKPDKNISRLEKTARKMFRAYPPEPRR